ncbi:hypothetical protein [Priestia megaterium]|uniref:hypothetical protein n=1 Tax=Priestia megaterium TaxID=1404 RepID=UPI00112A6E33|nr:hypothetical protein [Priestia megaterium]TPF18032.1 hypothetical protein CBE78_02055 [Priestia megaterium]TPF22139.1 hypothetical protein CBE79_04560 [Priestia megaterium]
MKLEHIQSMVKDLEEVKNFYENQLNSQEEISSEQDRIWSLISCSLETAKEIQEKISEEV